MKERTHMLDHDLYKMLYGSMKHRIHRDSIFLPTRPYAFENKKV
jgi:hypothetical protein